MGQAAGYGLRTRKRMMHVKKAQTELYTFIDISLPIGSKSQMGGAHEIRE